MCVILASNCHSQEGKQVMATPMSCNTVNRLLVKDIYSRFCSEDQRMGRGEQVRKGGEVGLTGGMGIP